MKKKLALFMIFVLFIQIFGSFFVYVDAKDNATPQPAVCAWPSETMQKYFDFQNEMMGLVLWTELAKKRFETQRWNKRLFSNGVLDVWPSLLDLVSTSVAWNLRSAVSTSITSMFLLNLSLASVIQANTEWLWILFKDRPIVREYKEMLDIETSWIEMAFFLSESGNLDHIKVNSWDVVKLVKKYQNDWLFTWNVQKAEITVADIMMDMVIMNGYMKHYILYNKWLWKFKACLNNYTKDDEWNMLCKESFGYRFSDDAINQLKDDYKWIWMFGACNHLGSNFLSTINKWIKNNARSMEAAMDDVKNSMNNLKSTLLGKNWWSRGKDRCNMSDYEMAQLKAYRWGNWECNQSIVSVNFSYPKDYTSIKKSQKDVDKKTDSQTDAVNDDKNLGSENIWERMRKKLSFNEKSVDRYNEFCTGSWFNSHFMHDVDLAFSDIFYTTMWEFDFSQRTAIAWDISMELIKIKWLLDEIWSVSLEAKQLEEILKKISNYQCR